MTWLVITFANELAFEEIPLQTADLINGRHTKQSWAIYCAKDLGSFCAVIKVLGDGMSKHGLLFCFLFRSTFKISLPSVQRGRVDQERGKGRRREWVDINLSVVWGSLTEGRVLNHRRLTKLQCTLPKAGGMFMLRGVALISKSL